MVLLYFFFLICMELMKWVDIKKNGLISFKTLQVTLAIAVIVSLIRSPGLTVLCLPVVHEHFDMFNRSSYFIKMRRPKKKQKKTFNTFLHIFMLLMVFYFLLV